MATEEEERNPIDETLDKVAELLNDTSLSITDIKRIENLKKIQEIILHKNPTLLDNFLDEILQFQLDHSCAVKKFVVSFIEEACKLDNEVIFKVIDNFRFLLFDDNVNVQKRAFVAMISIFKNTLKWIVKRKLPLDKSQKQTWLSLIDLKNHIAAQLDSDNDGIRISAIKFIEMLIIVMSPRLKESIVPAINDGDISLDQINTNNQQSDQAQVIDKSELLEEGRHHMRKLIEYTLSTHISGVNLIASISVLSNISKQRPEYMNIVLETYSKLIANMPPTLGKSQVSTVRKQLKLQILSICKNPCCIEFQPQISTLLSELGCSSSEIAKAMPKVSSEARKRSLASFDMNNSAKKSKQSSVSSLLKDETKSQGKSISEGNKLSAKNLDSFVDDLVVKLQDQENIADLVIVSMAYLPENMPEEFQNSYKPISAAGTTQQIKGLARMLALQLKDANLINLTEATTSQKIPVIEDLDNDDDDNDEPEFSSSKSNLIQIKAEKKDPFELNDLNDSKQSFVPPPTTPIAIKPPPNLQSKANATNKVFKLNEVTSSFATQFTSHSLEELLYKSYTRVLNADEIVSKHKDASLIRKRVLVETTSLPNYDNHLTNYIFEDVRKRIDLGLMWIYNSYLNLKNSYRKREEIERLKYELANNLARMNSDDEIVELPTEESKAQREIELNKADEDNLQEIEKCELDYDKTLYTILYSLQQRQDQKDFLFSKTICQVPVLTDRCLGLLKNSCQDESRYYFSLTTLCDLIMTRLSQRQILLNLLVEFTHYTNPLIRENAITITLRLYEKAEIKPLIEEFALERLNYLALSTPPRNLFDQNQVFDEHFDAIQWTEDSIKSCLYLYLDLLPINHELIHPLSQVYIPSISEVKRVILKMIEAPIKSMGMESEELLKLIVDFPQGSETLVLRIIHILTEKTMPSEDLVNRVRDLYERRLSDVRFIIPILTGLTKKEITAALPQLIKLSQPVVKEVFNRLLGVNSTNQKSPITPAELLVSLHQIDANICDLKTIISATSLCFAEKQVYTQEVLTTVMQQLIDVTPIPTLYMRTLIQSVTMYPKLTGFVIIMMQRLIDKQIWKYPKVWEGFVKFCQRFKLISHRVLLQLPPAQLKEVFSTAADLKEHVCKHVLTLDPQQRAKIPEQLLQIIEPATTSIQT